jgi:anti-sigma factor RsiW
MVDDTQLDGHVQQSLGLYVLGNLPPADLSELNVHLSGCATCRAELRSLREATVALALLSIDEAESLTAPVVSALETVGSGPAAVQPSPAIAVRRAARRGSTRIRAPLRWFGRHPFASPAYTVAAAAALALVIGFGVGWLIDLRAAPARVAVTAAYTSNQVTGVSMSASAYAVDDKISIQASVSGLKPNETYLLYVVTSDGSAHLVQQWSSPSGSKVIDQDLNLVGSLAYFIVIKTDGTVVMLAWCQPGPTPGG